MGDGDTPSSSASGDAIPVNDASLAGPGDLPQDIFRYLINPALLNTDVNPLGALLSTTASLSAVNRAARATVQPMLDQLRVKFGGPLGAEVGDHFNAHAAIMRDENATINTMRQHMHRTNNLRHQIMQTPRAEITLVEQETKVAHINQLRRDAATRINEMVSNSGVRNYWSKH